MRPWFRASRNFSRSTPAVSPTSTWASGSDETACHISVLPRPPAACSWAAAYASSGCTWMDNLSLGKMNFTRMGKSRTIARREPRHSGGICRHASPSDFPAKGPVATLQSMPVSQASPRGSVRLIFSGKSGAREREPQSRGLKIGSIRNGSGFIQQASASELQKSASSIRMRLRPG